MLAEGPTPGVASVSLLMLMLVACTTPSVDGAAPAYDPTSLTSGAVYHWPVGSDIAIYVVEATPSAQLGATARTAAADWARSLAYREHVLRFVDDATLADIIIRDGRAASPVETTGCGGPGWSDPAGSTFFCPAGDTARTLELVSGAAGRTKVLITISVAVVSADALLPIVLHEMGHALGIGGHSPAPADAMFGSPTAVSPSARDARTLRYLLHQRPDVTL